MWRQLQHIDIIMVSSVSFIYRPYNNARRRYAVVVLSTNRPFTMPNTCDNRINEHIIIANRSLIIILYYVLFFRVQNITDNIIGHSRRIRSDTYTHTYEYGYISHATTIS